MTQYAIWATPIPLDAIMKETEPHKMAIRLSEVTMPELMKLSAIETSLPAGLKGAEVVSHSFVMLGSSFFLTILYRHNRP